MLEQLRGRHAGLEFLIRTAGGFSGGNATTARWPAFFASDSGVLPLRSVVLLNPVRVLDTQGAGFGPDAMLYPLPPRP